MSDLPDEVMDRARLAAYDAYNHDRSRLFEQVDQSSPVTAEPVWSAVVAAARVLIEAERERIKARIEAVLDAPGGRDGAGFEAGLEAALSVIDEEGREPE